MNWQKAQRSIANSACVEVRRNGDVIEVRDSKDPDGPVLRFTRDELAAFLDGAHRGEFDHLLSP